jgi:hypothetical protein
MPASQVAIYRLELIERELRKAISEFPDEGALDRVRFVCDVVQMMRNQIDLDDEATIPILEEEIHPAKEYLRG